MRNRAGFGRALEQVHVIVHPYEDMQRDTCFATCLVHQMPNVMSIIVVVEQRAALHAALCDVQRTVEVRGMADPC